MYTPSTTVTLFIRGYKIGLMYSYKPIHAGKTNVQMFSYKNVIEILVFFANFCSKFVLQHTV